MKLLLYQLFFVSILTIFCLISCSKSDRLNDGCTYPDIVPFQPFSQPVWHPNGKIFGFNFTPLSAIIPSSNTSSSCIWYFYSPKDDSTGFYIFNIDGSGFSRITNYAINCPSWSPDGKWLAFSNGGNIYKMYFNGVGFDTTNIIKLTSQGVNFYPSWSLNSDTIFYDSNIGTNGQGYYIWSMASDSSGKKGFPNTGRYPFVGSDGKVYYSGLHYEIFCMNKNGTDIEQLTYNNIQIKVRNNIRCLNDTIFYEEEGYSYLFNNGISKLISNSCLNFDINKNRKIIYSTPPASITTISKQMGTLWIINSDGTNNIQITFNHI